MKSDAGTALNPAARPYGPRGAAKELFYCKAPEILMEGPAGTGKSRGVLEKVNLCLLKYPGSRWLICRKTRASMTESVLVTFEEKVVPAGSPMVSNQLRRVRQSYEYPNGSMLVVGGLDNPDRIMSTEYDGIALFEGTEATEDDAEKLTTRLRNGVMPYQQFIVDCNPSSPSHWLNQRASAGRMTRLLSRHEDNPTLFRNGGWTEQGRRYIDVLERLTGARYQRLRAGKWAAAEGLVYDGYDAAIHLIDPFPIPPEWRRIRSIDIGYVNPFVCQWWAIDPDGRMYRYRELYRTKRLVEEHAALINRLSEGETYEATVSDHDLDARDKLHLAGIYTAPAYKAVVPGIDAVSARLKSAGDKRPRLFLMRDARIDPDEALRDAKAPTCTEEEIDGYIYATGIDGKPRKEEPVKLNDHGLDAMRYAVAYADGLPTGPLEWAGSPTVCV